MSLPSKRICFIIHWFRGGGAENQLLHLVSGLSQSGYKCDVFCLANSNIPPNFEKRIKCLINNGVNFHPVVNSKVKNIFGIITRCLNYKYDYVWSWGIQSDLVGTLVKLVSPNVKLICSLRSAYNKKVKKELLFRKWIDYFASGYISNSIANCDIVRETVKINKAKLHLLNNIVFFRPYLKLSPELPKPLRIIMLGNLRTYVKGYDLVPEIYLSLVQRGINCEIIIAGRNDDGHKFLKSISEDKNYDRIIYAGEISDSTKFLSSGHLFLLTSRIEGMSNSLFEALMLGLPCVSTKVGDIGINVKNNDHLKITNIDDVDSIVNAICECYFDWNNAIQMGKRGRAYCVDQFNEDTIITDCMKILQSF